MNYKSLMIAVVATSAMGMTAANAGNTTNTALASALGGVVGAAVGNKMGGTTGATIGSAIGGGAGAAVAANKRDRNGAIIGGALGGGAGYAVGKNMAGSNGGLIGAALGSAGGSALGKKSAKTVVMMTVMTVAIVQKTIVLAITVITTVAKISSNYFSSLNKHLRMLIFLPVISIYIYIDFFDIQIQCKVVCS